MSCSATAGVAEEGKQTLQRCTFPSPHPSYSRRRLAILFRQLRKWNRFSHLLQVEGPCTISPNREFKASFAIPRKTARLSPYPLFDVGAVYLIPDVIGHVAVIAFGLENTFGHDSKLLTASCLSSLFPRNRFRLATLGPNSQGQFRDARYRKLAAFHLATVRNVTPSSLANLA